MSAASAPVTFASPALWAIARGFIVTFFNLFGAPEQIAERHTFTAKAYKQTLEWLRAGEALMRRLLLIEAAHYDKPNIRPLLRERRQRVRKPMVFHPESPEAWRVSFRCFATDCRRPGGKNRKPTEPQRFFSAWPLAERAEALLRAFNNPAPYAKRLARRLHATPHRAAAMLRHPENTPSLVGHESFAETAEPLRAALKRFEPG